MKTRTSNIMPMFEEHEDSDSDSAIQNRSMGSLSGSAKKRQKMKKIKTENIKTEDGSPKKKGAEVKLQIVKTTQEKQEVAENKIRDAKRALEYLDSWENDKAHWKFHKGRQIWLLKHIYDETLVPAKYFGIALKYFQHAKGNAHVVLTQDAKKIMESEKTAETKESHHRAKKLLKYLKMNDDDVEILNE